MVAPYAGNQALPVEQAGTATLIPVTNMLERLNEEIRRRTHVVRIFPNGESCLRLVRALAVETHENWLEQHRYLNMDDLREHKKEALRRAA
jgi:putative transposase